MTSAPIQESSPPADPSSADSPSRVRLRFAKRGDLRFLSHHDLMRCLERTLRRARLPVAHTQGFNPRPKATFALALGLGIEAYREVLDLDLSAAVDPAEVLARLVAESPPGFDFLSAESVYCGPGAKPARVVAADYRLAVPEGLRDEARAAVASLLESETRPYTRVRPDRTVGVDLRPYLLSAAITPDGDLTFRLKVSQEGSARPEEIVDTLGLKPLLSEGGILVREDLELASS